MKILITILFVFLCTVSSLNAQEYKKMIDDGTFTVQEVINEAETYFEFRDKGKGSGYKQFKRWEYMAERLMNEDGRITSNLENFEE